MTLEHVYALMGACVFFAMECPVARRSRTRSRQVLLNAHEGVGRIPFLKVFPGVNGSVARFFKELYKNEVSELTRVFFK